ncbi:MAG: hypothetical protein Q4E39_00090 [bacterium]|nr:hypothetical protein [bacterium]
MNDMEQIKKQHLNTYKNATKEIVINNTKALVENDIISLIKKPPLDSMDIIKTKLISLAKKEKIILSTEKLDTLIKNYRDFLEDKLLSLRKIREDYLIKKIDEFVPERETEIIKIQKKELDSINKTLKQDLKKILDLSQTEILFNNLDTIYEDGIDEEIKSRINKAFTKFMKSTYQKQLNESIAIKTMVKDRTLLSGILEQGERYLFTKSNSHLFDEEMKEC